MGEVCTIYQIFWVICAQKCWDKNETVQKETIKRSVKQSWRIPAGRHGCRNMKIYSLRHSENSAVLTRLHLSCLWRVTFFPHSFFHVLFSSVSSTPIPLLFSVPCPPYSHSDFFFSWLSRSLPPHTTIMLFLYFFVLYPISPSSALLKHTACKAL